MQICLIIFWLLMAQPNCPPIKVGNPEGNYIVPGVMGSIVYRPLAHTGGRELSLDAYVQKRGSLRPALLVVHGGNWDTGSRVAFTGQFLELLTHAGFNWFAVDYRLGGVKNYQDSMDDLRAAIEFIRCHSKEFRIDPNNIALIGEDSGANLALMLAADRSVAIKAVVSIGGLYDALLAQEAPITRDLRAMPPTMVIHGGNDREAAPQQAKRFCDALREEGRDCESIVAEGAIHRAENWLPSQWGYKALLTTWLSKKMRLAKADHEPYVTNLQKGIVYDARHSLKMDAYVPPGKGPHPTVIIVHGGGWEAGDRVTYVTPLFEPLAKAGFAWFSIDYRLTPQVSHPEQLRDLRRAIAFIRASSKRFRIDPNRIAILGESASAQMVTQVAPERLPGVAAVVSFYGVYDFDALVTEFSPRSIPARLFRLTQLDDHAREVMRRFSPIHYVRPDMPPLLLIHGTNERLYAQGVAMAGKLAEIGARFDFIRIEDAPHGIENWEGRPEWLSYKQQLVDWLRSKLTASAQTPGPHVGERTGLPAVVFDKFGPGIREQVRKADNEARSNPNDSGAVGRLAMILHAYDEFELASAVYRHARKLQPDEFRWIYLLANCQIGLGQHQEAVTTMRAALQKQPGYLPAQLKMADSLLAMNEVSESRGIYEAILEGQPGTAEAQYGLGRIMTKQGDAKGIESLKEAVRLSPSWGAAHYALALAYRDAGARSEAEEHLRLYQEFKLNRPVQSDPLLRAVAELNSGAADRLRKGVELEASGKLAESIAEHERALRINPQLAQAHINLIQLYGRRGLVSKAEEHYRAVVVLNPNLADSHYNFGVMLIEQKRLDDAAQAFRRAIEANPHFAEAHLNYGSLLEARQQFDEAMKHYQLAVENSPNNRLAHFQLARMLIYKNQLTDAIKHLKQTLTPEDGETPRFTYALAAAYARADDRENALKSARVARDKATALKQTVLLEQIEKFLAVLDREK